MIGKLLFMFLSIIYIYIILKGIIITIEERQCKKNYIKNRKKCKMITCRFYKNCKKGEIKNELDI